MQIKTANNDYKEITRGIELTVDGNYVKLDVLNNSELMYPMFTLKMSFDEFRRFFFVVDDLDSVVCERMRAQNES